MSRPFVLITGAWHGGWTWRPVAEHLRAAGHEVLTPTLPGLADRDAPQAVRGLAERVHRGRPRARRPAAPRPAGPAADAVLHRNRRAARRERRSRRVPARRPGRRPAARRTRLAPLRRPARRRDPVGP